MENASPAETKARWSWNGCTSSVALLNCSIEKNTSLVDIKKYQMESKMHLIYLYMFDLVGKLQSISLMMTKMTMMFFRYVFRSLIFFPIIQGTFQERLQVVWTKEFSRAIIHENLIWVFPKIGVRSPQHGWFISWKTLLKLIAGTRQKRIQGTSLVYLARKDPIKNQLNVDPS